MTKKEKGRRTKRDKAVRVKTAKGRKNSSTRWLQRQLNDPYVREAQRLGYRSRAVFKIKEIDDKLNIFKKGITVLDLGAAPGGWSQYAIEKGASKVIALDILPIESLPGVISLEMDFLDDSAPEKIKELSGVDLDIVMSDMAPNTTGHKSTDHIRIMALVEAAYLLATEVLKPGGMFIAKVFQGGAQHELLAEMKKSFEKVKHIKPPASRKESSEQYVVAIGYRGKEQ
jgi:23S rRNA (uridine2552-2'-O)-methyltransferase